MEGEVRRLYNLWCCRYDCIHAGRFALALEIEHEIDFILTSLQV